MQGVQKPSYNHPLVYITGVVLCISLVCYTVSAVPHVEDTCLMTLVVPKEKIKHTCDVQERFQKRLDALEGQYAYQAKLIKDLEMLLVKTKKSKDSVPEGDKTPQVIPEHPLFLPPSMPDLSDDYPDFDDYYPPDVSSRTDSQSPKTSGNGKPTSQSQKRRGFKNLLALDLLKPYIDKELDKLRTNVSESIRNTFHPFAAGFGEVRKFILRNGSRETNTVSAGAQTSINTIALSHMFVQNSKVHDKLLHMNTQHIILQKKVSVLESRVMSLVHTASQKTLDLRSRILELEHENRLLKMNQTCHSELQEIRLDIAKQISNAKDQLRINCKSRRRTKVRARIAQDDYYYDDNDVDPENEIDNGLKPLTEIPAFQELEKNVSSLQSFVVQHIQRLEESGMKSQATRNVTEMKLKAEILDRKQGDEHVNASTQSMIQQVQHDIVNLEDDIQVVKDLVEEIQQNIKVQQKVTDQQMTALRQLTNDLRQDTATNFSHQSDTIKNTSWTLGLSIHKLQKADEEHAMELESAMGKSNQKLTENRLSILEWRDRVWEHNSSITHLSKDLRQLSEEVHVSVLSLNESVRTLGVQFKLNNETWLPYSFSHSQGHTKCYGEKYVKKTNYPSGSIVGVVLCSPEMYKIFLSDALTETFLDVADSDGFGHDHCEFVGGKLERTTQLGNTPVFYKKQLGYKRHSWGEPPKKTYVGLLNPSPEWYRCGISIPG